MGHVTLSHRVPWHTGTVDGHRTHCKIDNGLFRIEFHVAVLHSADSSSSASWSTPTSSKMHGEANVKVFVIVVKQF